MMPGMDGYQVVERLKGDIATTSIPIIMVTALDDREARIRGLRAGAEDSLSKPIDRAELCLRVRNLLRLRAYGVYFDAHSTILEAEVASRTAELIDRTRDLERQAAALSRSEERTTLALAAASLGVWELDVVTRQLTWSATMTSLFGLLPDQAPTSAEAFVALIEPEDQRGVEQVLAGTDTDATDYELEFRVQRPGGGTRWHALRARLLCGPDGTPTRLLGVGADITEHKSLEADLRQVHKMDAVGQLAAGVAHDFNNMLTTIIGYSEMVLEQIGSDKPISGDLAEISKAGDRAAALTRQLLAFSRKQPLRIAAIDTNDVIRQTNAMLLRLIGEDVVVHLRLMDAAPTIRADRIQLEQVLMNLATNARDAMPRGGELTIETAAADASEASNAVHAPVTAGAYVRVRVTDTGIGMDAATVSRIFEPFFTTKGIGHGTGLGLATVFGVVQQLGGYITVTSEVGTGTTFTLYFRQSTNELAEESPLRPRLAAAPLAQHHEVVLIVEDEEGVRQLAARVLTRHGYTVLQADGPVQALKLAEGYAQAISLVLSDVVMPVMDGPALLARFRQTRPELKALYMSGYKGEMLESRGDLQARTRVLQKPFSASILLQAVRDVLAERVA